MSTKAIFVQPGGGYDNVVVGSSEARAPGNGEITVRLHANSLNYHDFAVVSGMWGPSENRIPMADGAGEVIAVGADVSEFKVGDSVVSTFFPEWIDGTPQVEGFVTVPGDGIDGYAREQVTAKATAFTLAPTGYSHAEASTLTTAGLTAWRALAPITGSWSGSDPSLPLQVRISCALRSCGSKSTSCGSCAQMVVWRLRARVSSSTRPGPPPNTTLPRRTWRQ